MKQNELAKILGMKPQYINSLIKGNRRPSADLAERLELATGVSRVTWMWGSEREKKEALSQSSIKAGRGDK